MNHETARYEKALKQQLRCTGSTKKRLLKHFRGSLEAFLEDHPSPTTDDLRDAFGPPEEMARVLMENINQEDRQKYLQRQNCKRILAVILVVLFFAYVTFVLFWKQKPLTVVDQIAPAITAVEE